jgi:carbonic anhydrase
MPHLPEHLWTGYRNFMNGRYLTESGRYRELAREGQAPETMIVACCDSRSAPEAIFDAGPGELFVLRNVGNLVPPYAPDGDYHGTSAAVEFAVQALNVKHVVVLGHAQCGAIQAFANGAAPLSEGDFISKWVTLIRPAAERLGPRHDSDDYLGQLERAAVGQSLQNLMTFPYVAERVSAGQLTLHGAYFGVATGVLLVRDADGTFSPAADISATGR